MKQFLARVIPFYYPYTLIVNINIMQEILYKEACRRILNIEYRGLTLSKLQKWAVESGVSSNDYQVVFFSSYKPLV